MKKHDFIIKRKELGYTQVTLAEAMGVKPGTIRAWEQVGRYPIPAWAERMLDLLER